MIRISDKSKCCGCSACVHICPKQCVSLFLDNEGFLYPKVNASDCIDCGLCEKVCPVISQKEEKKPLETIAALSINEDIRLKSSSGGIFTLLAENIIKQGGIVFGARFDEEWAVVIDSAKTQDEIELFRGSKYLQARIGDSYKQCKEELDKGKEVLFSGTPCQIAGLQNFLRKPYSNLLTVDFVCHGVPSPGVWKKYLEEVLNSSKKAIKDVNFRNKPEGWRKFHLTINWDEENNTCTLSSRYSDNPYMRAFLANMILRPSCYECPAKSGRSHSDITIADFWGVENFVPELDDDKGVSLVLVNTDKGKNTISKCTLEVKAVDYDEVIPHNPSITTSARMHRSREKFFKKWQKQESVTNYMLSCLKPTLLQRIAALRHPSVFKKYLHWGG